MLAAPPALLFAASAGAQERQPRDGPRRRVLSAAISEAPNEEFADAVTQAKGHGVSAVPLSVFWDDIEREPGRFEPEPNWTAIANQFFPVLGLRVQFVISVIDTNQDRRPAWLRQQRFNSPQTMASFARLIDWVLGAIPDLNLVSFAIGNEIDALLGNDAARWRDYNALWRAGAARVRAMRPRTPLGAKLTWGGWAGGGVSGAALRQAEALVDASDRLMVTYYPLQPDFRMKPLGAVEADIAALAARRRAKPIEIAEVGYSSSPRCGGSPARQAAFVRTVFRAWDSHRAAMPVVSLFSWTDFPPAQVDELVRYYGIESPGFRGFLEGLGLRNADGRPKPALAALGEEARARGLV